MFWLDVKLQAKRYFLRDEVVAESVWAVEEGFLHNLLEASFSDSFCSDLCVFNVFNRFLVLR